MQRQECNGVLGGRSGGLAGRLIGGRATATASTRRVGGVKTTTTASVVTGFASTTTAHARRTRAKQKGSTAMPSDRRGLGVFFVLLGLSGCAGLMYQAVCTHYIKLLLGDAVHAQTLVLAIVMAGMALGAWVAGHYSRRLTNLMIGYAAVEGAL